MKRLLFLTALLGLLAVSCDTNKTVTGQLANFTFEYPAAYELDESSDEYPDNAAFSLQHPEKDCRGIFNVLYYTQEEIDEQLAHRMDEFLESKLMDLFNYFEQRSAAFPIEDVSEVIPIEEDGVQGKGIFITGTHTESGNPYRACVMNYFEGNALVSALLLADGEDTMEELLDVAGSIQFQED